MFINDNQKKTLTYSFVWSFGIWYLGWILICEPNEVSALCTFHQIMKPFRTIGRCDHIQFQCEILWSRHLAEQRNRIWFAAKASPSAKQLGGESSPRCLGYLGTGNWLALSVISYKVLLSIFICRSVHPSTHSSLTPFHFRRYRGAYLHGVARIGDR